MKVYPDKLEQQLARGTAPIYFVHGDEPLQLGEIADRLRTHARSEGYDERQVIVPDSDEDWQRLGEAGASLSLFSSRRLIEVRLPTGKPGRAGGDAFKRWAADPPPDVMLLVSSGKLDRGGSSSAWFKAIEAAGVTIAVWPIEAARLPAWLSERLARHALQATPEAVAAIAERVEGNLLAAAQEVERLSLLFGAGTLEVDQVLGAVGDSARYSISDLVAASLDGDAARALHILRGLAGTGEPPVLVLWALNQEIRAGARAAEAQAAGAGVDAALKAAGVWANRQPALKRALARHDAPAWLGFVRAAAQLDRMIKGQEAGNVWNAFELLCAGLACGLRSPRPLITEPVT